MSTKLSELRASLENTLNEQHERYLQDVDHFQKELQELEENLVKIPSGNTFTFSERIKLIFNREQEIQLKAFLTPLQQQYEGILSTQLEHQLSQHSVVQANKQALFDETLVLENDFSELKDEHAELNTQYEKLDADHAQLTTEHAELNTQYEKLDANHTQLTTEYAELNTQHEKLDANHTQLTTEHVELNTQYEKLDANHAQLTTEHVELNTQYEKLDANHAQLTTEHTELNTQYEKLDANHAQLTTEHAELNTQYEKLDANHTQLTTEYAELNTQYEKLGGSDLGIRYEIIKHLLSARNEAPGITAYRTALYEDFIQFANDENSLEAEAEAILELQEIEKELEVVSVSPEFHSKRSVAVAGGFSAGKSEFISSFFLEDSLRLPIGIEPTSAIPVYVLNSIQGTGFMGYSSSGGMVDLLQIDPDISHKLSHNFIKTFGFNLKQIMPFVFLTTKINYDHLCFVDTPGYNPSDTDGSFQDEDLTTAEEFVHNAEALVWLIGMDAHGTISRSDLDFLEKVTQQEKNKPLYIVLNKADVKLLDDIEEIMEVVAETLDDYDIKYEGISAYSSISKTEYLYREQSLYDFFKKIDKRSDKQKLVLQKLYDVDERYQYAILKDMKQDRQVVSMLNSLKLDLLQSELGLDIGTTSSETLSKMDSWFDSSEKYERQLTALKEAVEKLRDAIDTVFGQRSKHPRKVVNIEDVRMDERYYKKGRA